eukprot:113410-Amphidinium_carterae.1
MFRVNSPKVGPFLHARAVAHETEGGLNFYQKVAREARLAVSCEHEGSVQLFSVSCIFCAKK